MKKFIRLFSIIHRVGLAGLTALIVFGCNTPLQPESSTSQTAIEQTDCTPEQRREELRKIQTQVLEAVPHRLESIEKAIQPDGQLAGWGLSHGYVVIAGGGAIPVDNIAAKDPLPQLLLYAPSPSSSPADWLDFDGADNPYQLVGWGYIVPYKPGSKPPNRQCVAASEWIIHEAGWHLKDGSMLLTPDAAAEPPRPTDLKVGIHMWHPQIWDIHFWSGDDGVPIISFNNPKDPGGGLQLPEDAFYYPVDGRKQFPPKPKKP